MQRLLHSRKFWIAVVDVVGSLLLYFVTKYAAPSIADDVRTVLVSVQPVILILIAAIAAEDVAEKLSPWEYVEDPQNGG